MESNTRNIWRRIGYAVAFVIVAGVAAYVSFGHIYEVALLAHQPRPLAMVLPLSVDGLMLIATLAIAEDKAANRTARGWARVSFWIGATVSVAANISSTLVHYGPEPLALAVAGWAPIALLLAIEVVSKPGKPKAQAAPDRLDLSAMDVVADDAVVPVSPAPAGSANAAPVVKPGRPSIPAKKGPAGKMVHAETGAPLAARTEQRKRKLAEAAE